MSSIAVIIATYNRADLLRGTLEALARQDDPGVPVSIAIADNGSTDETRTICAEFQAREPRFQWRYLYEPRPGKSHAVNTALAHTAADWLAFTDDDVRPERGWLTAIARAFRNPDVDFVVGRILPIWGAPCPPWLTPALYGALGVPDNGPSPCTIAFGEHEDVMPIGTNMAVRREALERVGGLRTDLGKLRGTLRSGEDHEFYLRLLAHGCRGRYVPDARVFHLVSAARLSRQYFRRWFYENGRSVATLEAAHPRRTPLLFGVPRYLWRQAATDVVQGARAALAADMAGRFRRSIGIVWFAGYLRETWMNAARHEAADAFGLRTAGHAH